MIFAIFLAVAEALQSDQICALETEGPVPWKAVPKLPRSRSAEGRAQRAPFLFQNDPLQSLKTPHNPVQRRVEAVRAQLAAREASQREARLAREAKDYVFSNFESEMIFLTYVFLTSSDFSKQLSEKFCNLR